VTLPDESLVEVRNPSLDGLVQPDDVLRVGESLF
jgi:hypothetical protein